VTNFNEVNKELEMFSPTLKNIPQVVVFNKIDVPQAEHKYEKFKASILPHIDHTRILAISAKQRVGLSSLMIRLRKFLTAVELANTESGSLAAVYENDRVDLTKIDNSEASDDFFIESNLKTAPGVFHIGGAKIEKAVQMTHWDYQESLVRFRRILDAVGIKDALLREGAKKGDTLHIGGMTFIFSPDTSKK